MGLPRTQVISSPIRRVLPALGLVLALVVATPVFAQGVIRDTEIETIIKAQSRPVLTSAGLDADKVEFVLIADKSLNAFATSGQLIGLHTGLIMEAETPNQLLGVIAHEAGHLSGGHTVRGSEMNRAGMGPYVVTMGLGILAALTGNGDAAIGLIGSSGYFGTLGALTYSRVQESAADQAGALALDRAGMSAQGLVDFFDKFRYMETMSDARRDQFFRSHPLSRDRIQILRRKVQDLPNYGVKDTPEHVAELDIVKAKLVAFLNPPLVTFQKYPESDTRFPARYARAIAYYQDTRPQKALTALEDLITEQPGNAYLWELKGQILFESSRTLEAEAPQRKAVEIMPDAPLLRVNLGQTLIARVSQERTLKGTARDAVLNEAIEHLQFAVHKERDNIFGWQLLAQAYDASDRPGEARLAAAEAQFARGDKRQARIFAVRAQEHLKPNTPDYRRAADIIMIVGPLDKHDKAHEEARGLDKAPAHGHSHP